MYVPTKYIIYMRKRPVLVSDVQDIQAFKFKV